MYSGGKRPFSPSNDKKNEDHNKKTKPNPDNENKNSELNSSDSSKAIIAKLNNNPPVNPDKQSLQQGDMEEEQGNKQSLFPKIIHLHEKRKHLNEQLSAVLSGIAHEHNLVFTKFVSENDIVVVWRPVNKQTAERLTRPNSPYVGKGLNTKGKSSEFGPIAGDIPCEAALSKIAISQPDHIKKFNKKIQESIEKDKKEYSELVDKNNIKSENLNDLNDRYLITSIQKVIKYEEKNYPLFYFKDSNGEVIKNDISVPIFAIRQDNQWLFYDDDLRTYNVNNKFLKKCGDCDSKIVENLAYRQWKLSDDTLCETVVKITADYDELVSAPRKIFPYFNNVTLSIPFDANMFFSLRAEKELDKLEFAAQVILAYEEKLKADHRDAVLRLEQPYMGVVNDWQRALKTHLKLETRGATNHGPEVNNPFPEKFSNDEYVAYHPDGRVIVLHNEQQICDFINEQRMLGFPLDVNPKWGWEVDGAGKLFIPENPFDWRGLEEDMQYEVDKILLLQAELQEFQKPVNSEEVKAEQEIKQKIVACEQLSEQYAANRKLVNLKIKIERLKLEPDIIYSDYVNSKGETPSDLDIDSEKIKFAHNVAERVKILEKNNKNENIIKLSEELIKLEIDFLAKYFENSLIAKYTEKYESNNKKHVISNKL